MLRKLATIGVYGFTADTFVAALEGAGVGVVLDIRQRRGVRGAEFAWANAQRLQALLAEHGIGYRHLKELAPTTDMRVAQYAEDARAGATQRTRTELGEDFKRLYRERVLVGADLAALFGDLDPDVTGALLCVEAAPTACHRSLVAERLADEHGVAVEHLRALIRPPSDTGLSRRARVSREAVDRHGVSVRLGRPGAIRAP